MMERLTERHMHGGTRGCYYYIDMPLGCPERPAPKNCYRHEGTPYRPKGG